MVSCRYLLLIMSILLIHQELTVPVEAFSIGSLLKLGNGGAQLSIARQHQQRSQGKRNNGDGVVSDSTAAGGGIVDEKAIPLVALRAGASRPSLSQSRSARSYRSATYRRPSAPSSSSLKSSASSTTPSPSSVTPSSPFGSNRSKNFKFPNIFTKPFIKALIAEFIGTGIIVGLGTGAVMSAIFSGELMGLFQVAAVWIIAVTIAIATTGPISGAHLNPAISIALAYLRPTKEFGWDHVLPYSIAQTAGAFTFSLMNYIMFSSTIQAYESANRIVRGRASSIATAKVFGEYFGSPVSVLTALLVEAFGTAVLSFVVFSLTHPKNDCQKNKVFIPPIIGATVGGLICVLAPLTQAGFNPARDFGPRFVALFAGWGSIAFQQWWVYVLGPIIGAVGGGALADRVLYADP